MTSEIFERKGFKSVGMFHSDWFIFDIHIFYCSYPFLLFLFPISLLRKKLSPLVPNFKIVVVPWYMSKYWEFLDFVQVKIIVVNEEIYSLIFSNFLFTKSGCRLLISWHQLNSPNYCTPMLAFLPTGSCNLMWKTMPI